MFFLDGTGFFSLICLLIQCILAWIFAAFFVVLSPARSPWLVRWRAAFFGLGAALTAVAVRFAWAHVHIAGPHTIEEGDPSARVYYAIYVGGKVAFLWFLIGGVAALRQRRWPTTSWVPVALITGGAAVGASVPTVESILMLQAPWVAAGFGYAWHCLRRRPGEPWEIGHRIVRGVFAAWAIVWLLYGIAAGLVGPVAPNIEAPANMLLRFNSLIDLSLQVALASGLIVVVMSDAQRATLEALGERDRLREQVQRTEKMRSLSTLVGGVAHEINNPLTAILGFAEDLGNDDRDVRMRAARVVQEQAERCRVIVQRMSTLGRRQPFERRVVAVDALVRRVVRGFERQAGVAGVAFEVELAPGHHTVLADGAAIEQVLTNLLANALHATPSGGRVVVRTRVIGQQVRFVVEDQGPGVPPADRDRIFEPFWTSKKIGDGTGIGLAVAETVVQAHDSRIEVGDSPLGGAQFEFALPRHVDDAAAPTQEAGEPAAEESTKDLDVLVVDDEPQVRSVIRRHVQAQGWRMVEAASGEQGLDLLLNGEARFDAVVCDLRMPGVSGVQLHDEISARAPHLLRRILFLTGDLASIEAREFSARCASPIVGKPFVGAELVGRLREVARAARAARSA